MKKSFTYLIFILFALPVLSQSSKEWENCTEGLEGNNKFDILVKFENELFTTYLPYAYSNDIGRNWQMQKSFDSSWGMIRYLVKTNVYKYKKVFIAVAGGYGFYISKDKQNWQKMKYELPKIQEASALGVRLSNTNIITTDSTIVIRCQWTEFLDSSNFINHVRTCISKGIGNDISENFVFDTISEKNDYSASKDEKYFNYSQIEDTLYAIYYTSKGGNFPWYYYSIDEGASWQKKFILNNQGQAIIQGGIKSINKIDNKLFILSSSGIWKPTDDGSYNKILDDKFSSFSSDFICEHKGMIYAQAYDTLTQKLILVRSKNGGETWERIGNTDYRITQLFSIKEELIAASFPYSIIASTDDGQTWEERNKGLFYSPDYYYQGPWHKIIKVGDDYLTIPRNKMLRNTIMKSYDGGKSWQRKIVIPDVGIPSEYLWANEKYNFTMGHYKGKIFATDRGSSKTYITYDKGETWEKYSDVSAFFYDNDKNMYERNDTLFFFYEWYKDPKLKYIHCTLDTGKTWKMYDSLYLQKLPEKSEHLFFKNGQYFAINDENTIFESTNDGKNWNNYAYINLPVKDSLYKLFYSNVSADKTILIFAYKEYPDSYSFSQKALLSPLYYTDDFGKSFKVINFPLINGKINPDICKFEYIKGKLMVLLLKDSEPKFSGLLNYNPEKNELTDIATNLEGNVITDILPVEDYLYISTWEGLFRIKVEPVNVKEETEKIVLKPIELYPNPANDNVSIGNNYYTIEQITIFDMLGREVAKPNFTQENFELKGISDGFYIVEITFEGGWSVHRKIIKK